MILHNAPPSHHQLAAVAFVFDLLVMIALTWTAHRITRRAP